MSTMREKFEAWAKIPIRWRNGETYDDLHTAQAWAAWQAATEAAKATGTAGDLPPLPERDGDWAGDDWFTKDTLREYGQACAEAVLCAPDGESWQHKFEETDRALLYWKAKAKQAEAALQPEAAAPVTIPKVEIELPAGDPRKVKIHLDTITDGVRWLCCTIESPAAQDLSAAILAIDIPSKCLTHQASVYGFEEGLKAAAALASSANALSAGDRVDADLSKYLRHLPNCGSHVKEVDTYDDNDMWSGTVKVSRPCTCGLAAILQSQKGGQA